MILSDLKNPSYAVLMEQIKAFSTSPIYRSSAKSWAYYRNVAYSAQYGYGIDSPFSDWDESSQGKRPFVIPVGKIIVDSGAEFLFSDPPKFLVSENTELETLISDVCDANNMEAKLLPMARAAANEGGVWLKFAWTPNNLKRPVAITTYAPYQIDAFYDPLDADVMESVRLTLKFSDNSGQWWLYRESWDTDQVTYYKPLKTHEDDDSQVLNGFVRGEWPVDRQEQNRFGVIPFVHIFNRRIGGEQDGVGDLWDIYDLLDNLAVSYWLQNRSNQWDADPVTAILGEEIRSYPDRIVPGDLLRIVGKGVDLKRLTPENNLREAMRQYALDIERFALDATGADRLNPAEITNMGNLTRQVMELVFHRSVRSAMEKRTNWGKCGFEMFFEAMLEGLSRLPDAVSRFPALASVNALDPATYDVVTKWAQMFKLSADERTSLLSDLVSAVNNGMLTRERAIETAAELFDIDDVQALKEELEDWEAPMPVAPKAPAESNDGQRNAKEPVGA